MTSTHAHDARVLQPDTTAGRPSSGVAADTAVDDQEGERLRQRLLDLILQNEALRKAQPR